MSFMNIFLPRITNKGHKVVLSCVIFCIFFLRLFYEARLSLTPPVPTTSPSGKHNSIISAESRTRQVMALAQLFSLSFSSSYLNRNQPHAPARVEGITIYLAFDSTVAQYHCAVYSTHSFTGTLPVPPDRLTFIVSRAYRGSCLRPAYLPYC
jgi:hypothetical protein